MHYDTKFKDKPAICIESSNLRATFLPEDGGKMASLQVIDTGKELLAVKPNKEYKTLTYKGSYVDSECSGFDDMFPTIDPYTSEEGEYKGITYPDHGEVCRLSFEVMESDGGIRMVCYSKQFRISYEKVIRPQQDSICILYSISNLGKEDFPFLWAGHIMLRGEAGMRLFSPYREDSPTELMFGPKNKDMSMLSKDRLGEFQADGDAYKFYYLEPMDKGQFGIEYPDGSNLIFRIDETKVPYLGVWMNNGSFQDIHTITPEPCTIPYDAPDKAKEKGYVSMVPAGNSFTFTLEIQWTPAI